MPIHDPARGPAGLTRAQLDAILDEVFAVIRRRWAEVLA
jgi:hypothetical protein